MRTKNLPHPPAPCNVPPTSQIRMISSGPDVQGLTGESPGSVVFRFNGRGIVDVEILTDQSDEEDTLRQRLTAAQPMLEALRSLFIVDPLTTRRIP